MDMSCSYCRPCQGPWLWHEAARKFGQDTSQDSTEVTVETFNERAGLVLLAIYTFPCGQKYTRVDIGETVDFLDKNGGVCLLMHTVIPFKATHFAENI